MTYTPKAGEVFKDSKNLEKLVGDEAIAIRISKNKEMAQVTIGTVFYTLPLNEGDTLTNSDFHYKIALSLESAKFNGFASRDMLDAELASLDELGNYAQYFDVLEYDATNRKTTLVKKARTNIKVVKDTNGVRFEVVNPVR